MVCKHMEPVYKCPKCATDLDRALFRETQRRERFEEDVWCAHKWLDEQGIPRIDVGGEVFSLVGRMMRLRNCLPKDYT